MGSYNSGIVKYKPAENGVFPSAAGRFRGFLIAFSPCFCFPLLSQRAQSPSFKRAKMCWTDKMVH